MKILAYDKFPGKEDYYVTLDELIQKSDVISLHCPLTEETHHMINEKTISEMKKRRGDREYLARRTDRRRSSSARH